MREDPITLAQLQTILKKEKLKYTVVYDVQGSGDGEQEWEIKVTHPTFSDITRLENRLESEIGVHVTPGDIVYEDLDLYLPKVYPMLQEKGKKRANILASAAGKKLGGVFQVTEGSGTSNNIFETGNYYRMIKEMMEINKSGLKTVDAATVSLIYRFELLQNIRNSRMAWFL